MSLLAGLAYRYPQVSANQSVKVLKAVGKPTAQPQDESALQGSIAHNLDKLNSFNALVDKIDQGLSNLSIEAHPEKGLMGSIFLDDQAQEACFQKELALEQLEAQHKLRETSKLVIHQGQSRPGFGLAKPIGEHHENFSLERKPIAYQGKVADDLNWENLTSYPEIQLESSVAKPGQKVRFQLDEPIPAEIESYQNVMNFVANELKEATHEVRKAKVRHDKAALEIDQTITVASLLDDYSSAMNTEVFTYLRGPGRAKAKLKEALVKRTSSQMKSEVESVVHFSKAEISSALKLKTVEAYLKLRVFDSYAKDFHEIAVDLTPEQRKETLYNLFLFFGINSYLDSSYGLEDIEKIVEDVQSLLQRNELNIPENLKSYLDSMITPLKLNYHQEDYIKIQGTEGYEFHPETAAHHVAVNQKLFDVVKLVAKEHNFKFEGVSELTNIEFFATHSQLTQGLEYYKENSFAILDEIVEQYDFKQKNVQNRYVAIQKDFVQATDYNVYKYSKEISALEVSLLNQLQKESGPQKTDELKEIVKSAEGVLVKSLKLETLEMHIRMTLYVQYAEHAMRGLIKPSEKQLEELACVLGLYNYFDASNEKLLDKCKAGLLKKSHGISTELNRMLKTSANQLIDDLAIRTLIQKKGIKKLVFKSFNVELQKEIEGLIKLRVENNFSKANLSEVKPITAVLNPATAPLVHALNKAYSKSKETLSTLVNRVEFTKELNESGLALKKALKHREALLNQLNVTLNQELEVFEDADTSSKVSVEQIEAKLEALKIRAEVKKDQIDRAYSKLNVLQTHYNHDLSQSATRKHLSLQPLRFFSKVMFGLKETATRGVESDYESWSDAQLGVNASKEDLIRTQKVREIQFRLGVLTKSYKDQLQKKVDEAKVQLPLEANKESAQQVIYELENKLRALESQKANLARDIVKVLEQKDTVLKAKAFIIGKVNQPRFITDEYHEALGIDQCFTTLNSFDTQVSKFSPKLASEMKAGVAQAKSELVARAVLQVEHEDQKLKSLAKIAERNAGDNGIAIHSFLGTQAEIQKSNRQRVYTKLESIVQKADSFADLASVSKGRMKEVLREGYTPHTALLNPSLHQWMGLQNRQASIEKAIRLIDLDASETFIKGAHMKGEAHNLTHLVRVIDSKLDLLLNNLPNDIRSLDQTLAPNQTLALDPELSTQLNALSDLQLAAIIVQMAKSLFAKGVLSTVSAERKAEYFAATQVAAKEYARLSAKNDHYQSLLADLEKKLGRDFIYQSKKGSLKDKDFETSIKIRERQLDDLEFKGARSEEIENEYYYLRVLKEVKDLLLQREQLDLQQEKAYQKYQDDFKSLNTKAYHFAMKVLGLDASKIRVSEKSLDYVGPIFSSRRTFV